MVGVQVSVGITLLVRRDAFREARDCQDWSLRPHLAMSLLNAPST